MKTVFSYFYALGDNALILKQQSGGCSSSKRNANIYFQNGEFHLGPPMGPKSVAFSVIQTHKYVVDEETEPRCSSTYKDYTIPKPSCPLALFSPIMKIFGEVKNLWTNVTTEVESLKTTLKNIQVVAETNAEISKELLEDPEFGKFCPLIIKNLLSGMKAFSVGESLEEQGEPGKKKLFSETSFPNPKKFLS